MPHKFLAQSLHFRIRAESRLAELGVSIDAVLDVASNPQQVLSDRIDPKVKIHQSIVNGKDERYLCRVFINFSVAPPMLVSFYLTSKIDKYWQT